MTTFRDDRNEDKNCSTFELAKYLKELSATMLQFSSSDDIVEAAIYLEKASNNLYSHEIKKIKEQENGINENVKG